MLRRAFTLVEVVIVIAIIAFATVVLFTGLELLLPSAQRTSPHEVLRKAVDAAWYRAAINHGRTVLVYDSEQEALIVLPVADSGSKGLKSVAAKIEGGVDDASEFRSRDERTSASRTGSSGAAQSGAGASAQEVFKFDEKSVTDVRFVRIPDPSFDSQIDTPYPRLVFAAAGGATPAIIEMDVGGKTFRYQLDIFGGALEELPP